MIGAETQRQQATLTGWMTLILLVAAAFRLLALTTIPPGMTHDEADHGITAQAILDGARDIYFTIGYGREPLYDYATAAVMGGIGETILAGRLTAAFFSLILIAGAYAWARRAFDAPTALLVAAGLAVGFWPVMAGRQALRSITLPALFVLSVYWYWRGLQASDARADRLATVGPFLVAGLLVGATVYTYIPARVLWLVFPAVAFYRMIVTRSWQGRLWALTAAMLLIALLVAAPLLLYLNNNPGLEVRVAELSAPLSAAATGDLAPLWANTLGSLRLFFLEGDPAWRYNVAGRPWFGPLAGALFVGGLGYAGWLAGRAAVKGEAAPGCGTAAGLALAWLVGGLSPVLVTGPNLSTTQAIGLLPVLYLFPALAFVAMARFALARWVPADRLNLARRMAGGLAVVLVLAGGLRTARDYFSLWANAPEVRVQYEAAMVTALDYLNESEGGDIAISTISPGPFHSPAVAALVLQNPAVRPRWFDGRESLLLPRNGVMLVWPGFTPVSEPLAPYLAGATLVAELPMRPDDLDRPLRVLSLPPAQPEVVANPSLPLAFGDAADLVGYDLPAAQVSPGETLSLVTVWRLRQPLPDARLFAQLVGPAGVVAQADRLGAPGELWQSGDLLLQDLSFTVPADATPGAYDLITGIYTTGDGRRLPAGAADHALLAEVEVVP